MPSLKQIGTICFLSIILISPTFATTPTLIPASEPGCNQAVLNTTSGSAALEAIYTANTINTTWYSNGEQLTGAGVPSSCTYDALLVPPTPDARPGYAFGGWTLRVPAAPEPVVPTCLIPSADVSNDPNAYGYKNDSTGEDGVSIYNTGLFNLTEDNTWGASWENGDKVTGVALCSQTSGTYATTGTPDETGSGTTRYCWCKATHYTANNAQQCSLSAPAWVFYSYYYSVAECAYDCAYYCSSLLLSNSVIRAAVLGPYVAQ